MIAVERVRKSSITVPERGTQMSAGLDLRSDTETTLFMGERKLLDTGFKMKVPWGYAGIIKPRSGLALKYGIDVMAGVIDSDYRGEVKVLLINHGDRPLEIKRGDRIAQLLVVPVLMAGAIEVTHIDRDTERADKGFGSTGVE